MDRRKFEPKGGTVYFYEPDGKGGRRFCRMERWQWRGDDFPKPDPDGESYSIAIAAKRPTAPEQSRNPKLAELGREYFLVGYTNVEYDAQGRIPRIGPVCYFYRPDGQVRFVRHATESGQCPDQLPDPKEAQFVQVLYDDKDKAYAAEINQPWEWSPDQDKTRNRLYRDASVKGWKRLIKGGGQDWGFRGTGNDRSGATGISLSGESNIDSPGKLDDNRYNQWWARQGADVPNDQDIVYDKGAFSRLYRFAKAMPLDVARQPWKLYDIDRVIVRGGAMHLYERYAPGPGNIQARVWMTGARNVARQEFFKDGKRVRAVVFDFTTKEENALYWDENLDQYKPIIKVPFENVYLRIYDYDANGKESLAAIGWTDYPRKKYYALRDESKRGVINGLVESSKDAAKKLVGKVVQKAPNELKYYYGTPDGKRKWKTFEEMLPWITEKGKYTFQDGGGIETILPDGDRTTGR